MCFGVKEVVDHSHRGARLEVIERRRWRKGLSISLTNIFDDTGPWHNHEEVRQEGQKTSDRHLSQPLRSSGDGRPIPNGDNESSEDVEAIQEYRGIGGRECGGSHEKFEGDDSEILVQRCL